MQKNIIPHSFEISVSNRRNNNKHNSFLIWFTGLSGSGKSTIANQLETKLFKEGIKTYSLDGDNIRKGINKDLTFSPEDRTENIRRIAEVANVMIDAGLVVLASFISPYKKDRDNIKNVVKDVNFVEVFVNTSLEECEKRDVKGLYKKARKGEIKGFTGIDSPYEAPINPALEIKTDELNLEESVHKIFDFVFCVTLLHWESP